MRKYLILLICILLVFTGCSGDTMATKITDDKFKKNLPVQEFDVEDYIASIEEVLADFDYIRIDSIFLDEKEQNTSYITELVVAHILTIYNSYDDNHTSYELINFLDMHVKKLFELEMNILLLRIVERIEFDYFDYQQIVFNEEFLYITEEYTNRITNTFLENYIITEETLELYPDIDQLFDKLFIIINGGYQIRKFNNEYHILPDYASILVRYDDYYSDEASLFVDILVRESRNVVKAGEVIQVDNDEIAYKINQLEIFLSRYTNSMYFDIVREIYINYLNIMVSNENNIEWITSRSLKYKTEVMFDFNEIIERYSSTEMARVLNEFVVSIEYNNGIYDEDIVNDIKKKILLSY